MSEEIGSNIKRIRKSLGLTQNDVAEKLFTTPQNLSRVESGEGEPTAEMLMGLATLFNVSIDTLVCRDRIPEEELMHRIRGYVSDAEAAEVSEKTFRICRNLLDGRYLACFGDAYTPSGQTHSTVTAERLTGVYADKSSRARLFAVTESRSVSLEETAAANLMKVFRGLTEPTVYGVLNKLSEEPRYARDYDRASFCAAFGIEDTEFDSVAAALGALDALTAKDVLLNGASVTLYRPRQSEKIVLLLSLADLLYNGRPDGNVH